MEDGVKSWSPERCKEVLVAYKEAYIALTDIGVEIAEKGFDDVRDVEVPGEFVTFLELIEATDVQGHINVMKSAFQFRIWNAGYLLDILADALVEVL